jgi:hypothetical protein
MTESLGRRENQAQGSRAQAMPECGRCEHHQEWFGGVAVATNRTVEGYLSQDQASVERGEQQNGATLWRGPRLDPPPAQPRGWRRRDRRDTERVL